MGRRRSSHGVRTLKERVRQGRFHVSQHADLEMEDEGIEMTDLTTALLRGKLVKRMTRSPKGSRYVMEGEGPDGRKIRVVCRLEASRAFIVTAYRVQWLRMKRMKTLHCDFCDGRLGPKSVTVDWRREGRLTFIEGVPALVCSRCGERYYSATVMGVLEEIGRRKGARRKTVRVPVEKFETVV